MMNAVYPDRWSLIAALAGILLTFASGALQIHLPASRWRQGIIRYVLNLGGLSMVVTTVLAWGELDRLRASLPLIMIVALALAAPLVMIGVMGLALRLTIRWVKSRQPGVLFPAPGDGGLGGLIGKIRKL